MQFINTLKDGDRLSCVYHIKTKSQATAKTGKEYFNVQLQDKTGVIDAKIWDVSAPGIEEFKAGDFVSLEGEVISYNGQLQVKIARLRIADDSEYIADDYFAASKYSKDDMAKELDAYIKDVKNPNFAKLLKSFFIDDIDFRNKFLSHQGAKIVHHSFISGLVEHTLATTKLAKKMAECYDDVNIDLIVTTCLLHDIGKVNEIAPFPTNEYTDDGQLLGHIVIGYGMVRDRIEKLGGFSDKEKNELLHCIISHHGSTDFGSPKLPMLMEAYIVAQADNTDAKLEIMRESIESAKTTHKMDQNGFVGNNKFYGGNFRESKI